MKIDISDHTKEDRAYADTWQPFLPYVDMSRRLSIIAQLHHDMTSMFDRNHQAVFQSEAEVRVACTVIIIKSDVLNDVKVASTIYRYLITMGVDVESMNAIIASRYKTEEYNTSDLPMYVVTSPLSKYQSVADRFIGDGTVIGFGRGEEADLFIRMRRPPAVIVIGGINTTIPDAMRGEYSLVFTGSPVPKDPSFGVVTYVRNDQPVLTDIIQGLDNVDLTDV